MLGCPLPPLFYMAPPTYKLAWGYRPCYDAAGQPQDKKISELLLKFRQNHHFGDFLVATLAIYRLLDMCTLKQRPEMKRLSQDAWYWNVALLLLLKCMHTTIIKVNLKVHKNSQATKMNLHQWQLIAIIAIYEGRRQQSCSSSTSLFYGNCCLRDH